MLKLGWKKKSLYYLESVIGWASSAGWKHHGQSHQPHARWQGGFPQMLPKIIFQQPGWREWRWLKDGHYVGVGALCCAY